MSRVVISLWKRYMEKRFPRLLLKHPSSTLLFFFLSRSQLISTDVVCEIHGLFTSSAHTLGASAAAARAGAMASLRRSGTASITHESYMRSMGPVSLV